MIRLIALLSLLTLGSVGFADSVNSSTEQPTASDRALNEDKTINDSTSGAIVNPNADDSNALNGIDENTRTDSTTTTTTKPYLSKREKNRRMNKMRRETTTETQTNTNDSTVNPPAPPAPSNY